MNPFLTEPNNPQALIIGAYLEEKKKWEESLNFIKAERFLHHNNIAELRINILIEETLTLPMANEQAEESIIWRKICSIFHIKTTTQKKIDRLYKKIDLMKLDLMNAEKKFKEREDEYFKVSSNPPNTDQYELAMMGNSLFKPR